MIKFQITAPVQRIQPVQQIQSKSGGQPFQKRELILDDSWEKDGKRHENPICVEFTGEGMSQLDAYRPGQRVTVDVYVVGRESNGRFFSVFRGKSITPAQVQTYPQQAYSSHPHGAYPQAPYPAPAPYPQNGYPQ